jgi:hypothetical protein
MYLRAYWTYKGVRKMWMGDEGKENGPAGAKSCKEEDWRAKARKG